MYITRSKQNGAQLHSRESATFAYCETVMRNSQASFKSYERHFLSKNFIGSSEAFEFCGSFCCLWLNDSGQILRLKCEVVGFGWNDFSPILCDTYA